MRKVREDAAVNDVSGPFTRVRAAFRRLFISMAEEALNALRVRVGTDVEFALRLRRIAPEQFVDDVRAIAAEFGFDVSAAALEAGIAGGRRVWALRWIV